MKNRLLFVGILIGLGLGVGAILFSSATEVAAERTELVGELLAGGAE